MNKSHLEIASYLHLILKKYLRKISYNLTVSFELLNNPIS